MCLSIPAKLLRAEDSSGVADLQGNEVAVDLSLVPQAAPGDYLLIHAGFALQVYDEEEARQTLADLKEALGGDSPAV
jgi:hydrogenase expression/formation protein HypC